MEEISPKLTPAQVRVMGWLSQSWATQPGPGTTVHVNGQRLCTSDTMMALYRAGFATRDHDGCWRATQAGKALRDRLVATA